MKTLTTTLLLPLAIACKSGETSPCIDASKINKDAICTMIYQPVCGCNGRTYGNECEAANAGVTAWTEGACED